MGEEKIGRRLRILVTDEDTGESVVVATGVRTMGLVVTPDSVNGEPYRCIIEGDSEVAQSLLLDALEELVESTGSGSVLNFSELLQSLCEDALGDLPVH